MRVCLAVPLYNEEGSVDRLLRSIAAQTRLPDEVVCVDAGSTDGTAERIAAFVAPFPLRLVRSHRLHPGQARNEAVRHSTCDWLAFTDGGVELDARWLGALLAAGEGSADVIFGSYEPSCETFFRRCAALAYVPPPTAHGIRGPSVATMVLSRTAFDRTGGFPPFRAAEDLMFLEKLQHLPLRVAFAPEAVVRWDTAPTPRATFRRFARYSEANLDAGRGAFWHHGLARQYAAVAAALVACVVLGVGASSLVILPLWLLARAAKAAWQKHGSLPFETWNPAYLVGAAGLLIVLDLATWVGALRFWRKGGAARTPPR